MSENKAEDKTAEENTKAEFIETVFSFSASLLWEQRYLLLPLLALLVAVESISFLMLEERMRSVGFSNLSGLEFFFITRFAELICLGLIARRSLRNFSSTASGLPWSVLTPLLIYGTLYAVLVKLPELALTISAEAGPSIQSLAFLSLILAPACIFFAIRHFYFFFPIMLGLGTFENVFSFSRDVHARDRWLALRSLAFAAAFYALISGAIYALSPDGRNLTITLLARASSGIAFFCVAYPAIAASILSLSELRWRELKFDPYREARISTLKFQCPRMLLRVFSPKKTLHIFFLAFLVLGMNQARMYQLEPSAAVTILDAQIAETSPGAGTTVTMQVELTDEKYGLRGFKPWHLRIANAAGTSPPGFKTAAFIQDSLGRPVPIGLDFAGRNYEVIELQFKTDKKIESLRLVEDVTLWYLGSKLAAITFSEKEKLPEQQSDESIRKSSDKN